ncbi:MAG: prevent-host-death protein [Candidatus Binatia bacterium]|jgi:PHD/YefM family antitoxin component YafN of YafNO toxin-antitoxin module
MKTIAAREIKRRGIQAVEDALKEGPVHIIKNDQPTFVVLDEEHYRELVEAQEQAYVARIKASLQDVKAKRVRRVTAKKLIEELGLED